MPTKPRRSPPPSKQRGRHFSSSQTKKACYSRNAQPPNKVIVRSNGDTESHFESLRAIELAAKLDGDLAATELSGVMVVNQVRISIGGAVQGSLDASKAVVDVDSASL